MTERDQGRDSDDDIIHAESPFSNPDAHAGYAQRVCQAEADGEIDRVGEAQMARHGDGVDAVICSKDVCKRG